MTRSVQPGRSRRHTSPAFGCEQLEARLALSTVHWDGGGDGVTLTDRFNWESDQVPNGGDHAVIDIEGSAALVHASGNFVVKQFTLGEELTVAGGMISVSHGTLVTGQMNLAGGRFAGHGDLSIDGKVKWTGGKIWGNGKVVTNPEGTFVIAGDGEMDLRRDVYNHGATVWQSGNLGGVPGSGTSFVNEATGLFKITGDVKFRDHGSPDQVTNRGTVVRDGEGTAAFLLRFDNYGTFNVVSGRLLLHAGGENSGPRHVAAEGVLHYYGDYTHLAGSTLTGGGITIWQGGTHTITDDWTMASFVHVTNATIAGPGTLSIEGPLTWNHGLLDVEGGLVINPGGKISLMTPGVHRLSSNILNNGTLIWNNGQLVMDGATITNAEAGNFYVQANGVAVSGGPSNRIVNQGEIRKQLLTSTGFGGVTLDNAGFVNVRNGTLTLDPASVLQTQGPTLAGGRWSVFGVGSLVMPGAAIETIGAGASVTRIGRFAGFDALNSLARNEGALEIRGGGAFEVTAPEFTNAGTLAIRKGTALRVHGDFVQTSTGVLEIHVSSFHRLYTGRVLGLQSATLAGTVSFEFSLYSPFDGDRFFFLAAPTVTGTFDSLVLTGADSPSGVLVYQPNGVELRFE